MLYFYSEKKLKNNVQNYVLSAHQITCKKSKWHVFWDGESSTYYMGRNTRNKRLGEDRLSQFYQYKMKRGVKVGIND